MIKHCVIMLGLYSMQLQCNPDKNPDMDHQRLFSIPKNLWQRKVPNIRIIAMEYADLYEHCPNVTLASCAVNHNICRHGENKCALDLMKCLENMKRDRNDPELCGEGIDNVIKETTNLEISNTSSRKLAWLLILTLAALPIASAVGGGRDRRTDGNNTETFNHRFTIIFCHANRRSTTHCTVPDVLTNLGNLNVRTNRRHLSAGSQSRGTVLRDGNYFLDFCATSSLAAKLHQSGKANNLEDFVQIPMNSIPVLYKGSISSKELTKLTLMHYYGQKIRETCPAGDQVHSNNQQVLHVDSAGIRNFLCLANFKQAVFDRANAELKSLVRSGSRALVRRIMHEQMGPNIWARREPDDPAIEDVAGIPLPPTAATTSSATSDSHLIRLYSTTRLNNFPRFTVTMNLPVL